MKRKFKAITKVGKGETKVSVQVGIETSKFTLTSGEVTKLKKELQDEVHGMLMRKGYYACEIKIQ